MENKTKKILRNKLFKSIANRIVNEINPQKLIVFGSTVKGSKSKDSDIDLLIIEKENFAHRSRRKGTASS